MTSTTVYQHPDGVEITFEHGILEMTDGQDFVGVDIGPSGLREMAAKLATLANDLEEDHPLFEMEGIVSVQYNKGRRHLELIGPDGEITGTWLPVEALAAFGDACTGLGERLQGAAA